MNAELLELVDDLRGFVNGQQELIGLNAANIKILERKINMLQKHQIETLELLSGKR